MAGIDRGQAVEVSCGDCLCPGSPHAEDLVWMTPKVDLAMALAATSALNQASDYAGDNEAAIYSVFVRRGVVDWNVVDDKGKPRPVTYDNILDRLQWLAGGRAVALKGRDLYWDQIFLPPAKPSVTLQPPTPSNGSTSRSHSSGRPPRSSHRPSSPSVSAPTQ